MKKLFVMSVLLMVVLGLSCNVLAGDKIVLGFSQIGADICWSGNGFFGGKI